MFYEILVAIWTMQTSHSVFCAVPKHGVLLFCHCPFCHKFCILVKLKTIQRAQLCTCTIGLKNVVLIETTWHRNIWKLALLCLLCTLFFTKFYVVIHLCRHIVSAHTGRTGNRFFVIHNLVHDISKWSVYTNWHITFKYRQSFVNHFNRSKGSDKKSGYNLCVSYGALDSGVST